MLTEGFNITYNKKYEWDSDKAEIAFKKHNGIRFYDVVSMLDSEDTYIVTSWIVKDGEIRIRVFGLAENGTHYECAFTERKRKKRIISAWKAGRRTRRKLLPALYAHNPNLMEHRLFTEQKFKVKIMKDWKDYPVDQEYWERELPYKKNIAKVMEGTTEQYINQIFEIGENKLFKILRKKYGFKTLDDGIKLHFYYPITAEDIRKYG